MILVLLENREKGNKRKEGEKVAATEDCCHKTNFKWEEILSYTTEIFKMRYGTYVLKKK